MQFAGAWPDGHFAAHAFAGRVADAREWSLLAKLLPYVVLDRFALCRGTATQLRSCAIAPATTMKAFPIIATR
jgi:hypothetical protein